MWWGIFTKKKHRPNPSLPIFMSDEIKINKIARLFGTKLTVGGFKMIRSGYSNLTPVLLEGGAIDMAIKKIVNIPITIYDLDYYSTSKENWEEMLDIISQIIVNFPWEKEIRDCDNRAGLVSDLCSLFYGVNTCGRVYCETTNIKTGKKSLHYANLVILENGGLLLYDVDNFRLIMKLEPNKPITMGVKNYKFFNAYFG